MPAMRSWSSSRALSGAVLRPSTARSPAGVIVEASTPRRVLVRVELDPAEPARVLHAQVAAVVEPQREAVPPRLGAVGRVLEPLDRSGPVDQQPPAHPEVEAEHAGRVTPVVDHVEQQALADPAGRGEGPAVQRGVQRSSPWCPA